MTDGMDEGISCFQCVEPDYAVVLKETVT